MTINPDEKLSPQKKKRGKPRYYYQGMLSLQAVPEIDGWGTLSPERSQIKWSWSLVSCPFNIQISVGNRNDYDPTPKASWCSCITACDISSRVAWGNCCLHRPNNSVSLTCGSGKSNYQLQRWAHWGPRAALKAPGCHPFSLPTQNENWVVCRVIKCVC